VSEQDHGADEPTEPSPGDDRESAYELLQRGHDLLTQRHFAQAAVVLERADRDEPGKGSILEALGRAYYNSGQHDRSRATFESLGPGRTKLTLIAEMPSLTAGAEALGGHLERLTSSLERSVARIKELVETET
jgi:hypothetical protein